MLKYITIFLLLCIVSLSMFVYWNNLNYKKIINEKDEKINTITKEKLTLEEKLSQVTTSLRRYKYNLQTCYKNNKKQEQVIEEYQQQIKELNQKFVQTKDELEKTIESYKIKLEEINSNTDNVIFPDNISEKTIIINDLLNHIINEKSGDK